MKAVNQYITNDLLDFITFEFKNKEGVVEAIPSNFKGYISSFGASIIQSGLIPTLAFYSQKENAEEDNRR